LIKEESNMDRRFFLASLAGGAVAAGTLISSAATAAPAAGAAAAGAPVEMQWGYGYGWRRRHWGRPYGFYGPRPWGPRPWRRCWINRWGERVCRF
jgi:hypothetical protein